MTTAMAARLDQFVILLNSAIAQRKLYFAGHPKVQAYGRELSNQLRGLLDALGEDLLFLGACEGKLVYGGRYLVGPTIAGGQLVRLAEALASGGLIFHRGVDEEELQRFLSLAAELMEPLASLEEARALVRARGIRKIQIAAPYHEQVGVELEDEQDAWQGEDASGGDWSPILVYQALFDLVTTVHGDAARGRRLDLDTARSVGERLLHGIRGSFSNMMTLVHYPDSDSYTVGHSVRVATLAVHVGRHLGLDEENLQDLGTAALLHDVGKSKIPDEILHKRGRLDKEEFAVMKRHAELGAEILLEHRAATPLEIAAAWGHHLRHDRGGYPPMPPWAARHPATALLQICDVFEALTAVRPYKPPLTARRAYEVMLDDRGAFDPALLRSFVECLGLYPVGNLVRLSDGTRAVVVAAGSRLDRPQVRLTHDGGGRRLGKEGQRVVRLEQVPEAELGISELVLSAETVAPVAAG